MTSYKRRLYIDLETFGSVNIKKAGAFKYVENPDFEIILLAYAWNDEPVRCIEPLKLREDLDRLAHDRHYKRKYSDMDEELQDVIAGLLDPNTVKVAHNSAFERAALAKSLRHDLPPEEWEDTMVLAAMNGLPMSLDAAGAALQLQDQKIKEGTLLINYFCKPCKPTVANGGRTRNLPEHAPDKWERFVGYCVRDVEVARTIDRKLSRYTVTDEERKVWALVAGINARGVLIV